MFARRVVDNRRCLLHTARPKSRKHSILQSNKNQTSKYHTHNINKDALHCCSSSARYRRVLSFTIFLSFAKQYYTTSCVNSATITDISHGRL
ncbi:uncharacterized protein MYCGRDRAFT_103617, partial [Zymoseptoria tritici IPO323]